MANEATFTITLDAEGGNLNAVLSAFKKTFTSTVSDLEKQTANLKLFGSLDSDLKKAAQSVDDARARLEKLRDMARQVQAAGENVGKDLAKGIDQAAKAAAAAEKDFIKQSQAVDALRTSLSKSGVDLSNLAAAEAKLAEQTRLATAAQVEQQNKMATGFKTLKDVQPEINKIVAAYQQLAASGKLSFGELSSLQGKAQQQINKLASEVGGLGAAFTQVKTQVVAFAAAMAGAVVVGANAAKDYRDFTTQIAAIGTIIENVTEPQLKQLEQGVRDLARTMGTDAVDSAKALYDIIGSGIAPDNSLEVLATASKAARAGLIDVHTAAAAGVAILNGYGLQVTQLEGVYDILFKTVQDGVVTFGDLAKNIGNVIPVARAANVPLTELGAAFVVLTRQGIDAPESATAIARAITELSAPAPAAAEAMRDLGISFNGLLGTVQQFAKLNLSLDQIQRLIPETRAAKAVLGLAQNFELLRKEVTDLGKASGAMTAAYERMSQTPQAKVDRFNASMKDLSLSLGQFVTNGTGMIQTLTEMVNGFNALPEKTRESIIQFTLLTAAVIALSAAWKTLGPVINIVVGQLAAANTTTIALTNSFTAAGIAAGTFKVALAGFAGFKLGEILYEWSSIARVLGDVLGNVVGFVVGLASAVVGLVKEIVTLNFNFGAVWRTLKADLSSAFTGLVDALTLTSEKSRSAAADQAKLGDALNKTAQEAGKASAAVDKSVSALLASLDTQAKQIATALTTAQSQLSSLSASLATNVGKITSSANEALQQLAATVQQQLGALTSVDLQRVKDTVKIQADAATQRFEILKKLADDTIKLAQTEADARRAIASKTGEDQKRVEQSLLEARRDTLQKIVDSFRQHVIDLETLQRAHLDRIRELEKSRLQINEDIEAQIRDIRRGGLTAYQQYNDRVREIDELTSKARQALQKGDFENAERYAKQAVSAAASVGKAVEENGQEVVSQASAAATAIRILKTNQDTLNQSIAAREDAEKKGAQAAAAGLKEAIPLLEKYKQELAEVTALADKGIRLRIEADSNAVQGAVDKVAELLAKQEVVLRLTTELRNAQDELKKASAALAEGIPVDIKPQTEKVKQAIDNIKAEKPELRVETAEADAKVAKLQDSIKAIDNLKTKSDHTVTSNVDDVQGQIDKLKEPTKSTHTVEVEYVNKGGQPVPAPEGGQGTPTPGFRRGGLVGGLQRFARGGQVGGRVPGSGSGDTVPALLRAGQYVVKKSASAFYGPRLMGSLARFAGGGQVSKEDAAKWAALLPLFGGKNPFGITVPDVTGPNIPKMPDSFQENKPPVNFDTRPIPEALLTAINVLAYAREMLNAVGSENPLLGSLKPAILSGITAVERNPSDKDAIVKLLQAAETIGSNPYVFAMWGKTTGAGNTTPIWFVDWLEKRGFNTSGGAAGKGINIDVSDYAANILGLAGLKAGPSNILKGNKLGNLLKRFAGGGSSSDTVPAMLTPGEYVVRKSAVATFGVGLLDAINNMRLPRHMLAGMLAAPSPVYGYATGGFVGTPESGGQMGGVGNTTVVNINASAADILNERNIRNWIVPVIRKIQNQGGNS